MVKQLAVEYAGRPVVFLEQNVDYALGGRLNRFWAAFTGNPNSVYLPVIVVDSGHLISYGPLDFYSVYKGMIETELARSPVATVDAYARRIGNSVRVYVRATNGSGITLSAATEPSIQAIVWEETSSGLTGHTVRDVISATVTSNVAPGAPFGAVLDSVPLSGVNWDKLHTVAFAEYRPNGTRYPYDMMQATAAGAAVLTASPSTVAFQLDADGAGASEAQVALSGPHMLSWTATSDSPWLAVSPSSGGVPATATLSLVTSELTRGESQGTVTFTATSADGMSTSATVTVQASWPEPGRLIRRRLSRVGD